jgi:hypothetical protein
MHLEKKEESLAKRVKLARQNRSCSDLFCTSSPRPDKKLTAEHAETAEIDLFYILHHLRDLCVLCG